MILLFIHEFWIQAATNKRSPSDFLKAVLGRPVNVRLNSGTDYKGEDWKNRVALVLWGSYHNNTCNKVLAICISNFRLCWFLLSHFHSISAFRIQCDDDQLAYAILQESLPVWMGTWTLLWSRPRSTLMDSLRPSMEIVSSVATMFFTFRRRGNKDERLPCSWGMIRWFDLSLTGRNTKPGVGLEKKLGSSPLWMLHHYRALILTLIALFWPWLEHGTLWL